MNPAIEYLFCFICVAFIPNIVGGLLYNIYIELLATQFQEKMLDNNFKTKKKRAERP